MARSGLSPDESYVQGGILAARGLPQPTGATSYNGNNQLLAYGATALSYDFNGNLTTATDNTGTATYA